MQYGIRAANYPLIPDDLESTDLPRMVKPYKDKLFGLTIQPERLQAIRQERRPNSTYAKIDTCRSEIADAQNMFKRHGIPFTNTTDKSGGRTCSPYLAGLQAETPFLNEMIKGRLKLQTAFFYFVY